MKPIIYEKQNEKHIIVLKCKRRKSFFDYNFMESQVTAYIRFYQVIPEKRFYRIQRLKALAPVHDGKLKLLIFKLRKSAGKRLQLQRTDKFIIKLTIFSNISIIISKSKLAQTFKRQILTKSDISPTDFTACLKRMFTLNSMN